MKLTADFVHDVANDPSKNQKFFDGLGLFLEVPQRGSKRWRLKYRFDGKEKLISLGTYPDTGLDLARRKALIAKKLLAHGINPSEGRKAAKVKTVTPPPLTVGEAIALRVDGEWRDVAVASITICHKPSQSMWFLDPYVLVELTANPWALSFDYGDYCRRGWVKRLHD